LKPEDLLVLVLNRTQPILVKYECFDGTFFFIDFMLLYQFTLTKKKHYDYQMKGHYFYFFAATSARLLKPPLLYMAV
jgi:hypothetical protein